jgi:hypothetical protein
MWMRLRNLLLQASLAGALLSVAGGALAQAQSNASLPCAVLGIGSEKRARALCAAVSRELGRSSVLVDDGRGVKRGDALHIELGDVAWTVVWLRDGQPRAFTRVSTVDAAGREALYLSRASRALERESRRVQRKCLRVEPNGGRVMRSADLAYPWVELKTCRVHPIDVVDPWWSRG